MCLFVSCVFFCLCFIDVFLLLFYFSSSSATTVSHLFLCLVIPAFFFIFYFSSLFFLSFYFHIPIFLLLILPDMMMDRMQSILRMFISACFLLINFTIIFSFTLFFYSRACFDFKSTNLFSYPIFNIWYLGCTRSIEPSYERMKTKIINSTFEEQTYKGPLFTSPPALVPILSTCSKRTRECLSPYAPPPHIPNEIIVVAYVFLLITMPFCTILLHVSNRVGGVLGVSLRHLAMPSPRLRHSFSRSSSFA